MIEITTAVGGSQSYINYGWETTYGVEATSIDKTFGSGAKISHSKKWNYKEQYGLGSEDVTQYVPTKYFVSGTVDCLLNNFTIFKAIIEDSPEDAHPGAYTHTFVPTNTTKSLTIEDGTDLDTDSVMKFLGCKITSCSIKCNLDNPVSISLPFECGQETHGTTLGSQVTTGNETPFIGAQCTFEIPNASAIGDIESLDLEINRNTKTIYGLGSPFATQGVNIKRKYAFTIKLPYEAAASFLTKFYGTSTGPSASTLPANEATAKLTISNGQSSTGARSLVFLFANARVVDDFGMDQDIENIVGQDVTIGCTTLTSLTVTDNTETLG